ncbi:MAG: efflux RND transporter permease subunit [Bacteroidales bacterium]|jgi:multidrug efflux pump subunit AcrB|nr:efflux RND transporter permease subunit [Bacteroidales bacterium]
MTPQKDNESENKTPLSAALAFLLDRPVAVLMTFLALLVIGWVSYTFLPVSLMPDVAIPEMTVHYSYPHSSARELENAVTAPLRRQLLQVGHLEDIRSETRDGTGFLYLRFGYGINTHYAFVEVNEKIDAAMHYLPRDMERPRVLKASATDIPVFYLNVSLSQEMPNAGNAATPPTSFTVSETDFLELSDFVSSVIRHRIEQLPEVAMADMSGATEPRVMIEPDPALMQSLGLTAADVENALNSENLSMGSLWVREGAFRYNIRLTSALRTAADVGNVTIRKGDRIIPLHEIAAVRMEAQPRQGMFVSGGQPAIALAIIKQSEARMDDLMARLKSLIAEFEKDYPDLRFETAQDQTALLDFSIDNLRQNLTWGVLLVCLILFFFQSEWRSPLLVAVNIPVSVVLCLIFFYLMGISFNIISLSGLIMAVGMMVDNSIIVTDNIGQYRARGTPLYEACLRGAGEVAAPLISSALTTVCIFVPLIFLSGIAGALFYDQAMGVAIGLGMSLLVSITLLPVLYRLVFGKHPQAGLYRQKPPLAERWINRFYEAGIRFTFRRPAIIVAVAVAFCISIWFFFTSLDVSRLPDITKTDCIVYIDWNEQVHPDENNQRITNMLNSLPVKATQENRFIGQQQFLISQDMDMGFSESQTYLAYHTEEEMYRAQERLTAYLRQHHPSATFRIYPSATLFDRIFESSSVPLTAALSPMRKTAGFTPEEVTRLVSEIDECIGTPHAHAVAFREHLRVAGDYRRLLLYGVNYNTLVRELKTACHENHIGMLRSYQQFVPLVIGGEPQRVDDMIDRLKVRNNEGEEIPVRALVSLHREYDLKTVTAGKDGEYVPVGFNIAAKEYPLIAAKIRQVVNKHPEAEVSFFGSIFENARMMRELMLVLLISLLMLYFILAAQFESLKQPFILLFEIPVDIAAALLLLWLTGNTLNLMSAIGIIVMCGIIINDSILKIDTINRLRAEGFGVDEAIRTAGKRRLKSIILTSLTTILAVLPLLFSGGMGAEIQQPFAWAIIGGMSVGTLVSLFLIPLAYKMLSANR